jgi:dihydroorotate dehydrogenase (NAD+) catalytic subunit
VVRGFDTSLVGLRLRNPLMNASGIFSMTALSLKRLADAGLGAVVTKSIGLEARTGNPNPTIVEVEGGLLNSMGLPNQGIDIASEEIREAVKAVNVPVIVSIFGFTPEEFEKVAKKLDRLPISALELNVSCPHVREVGTDIGQNDKAIAEVIRRVKGVSRKRIFIKLTPNVADIAKMAKAAEKSGVDGITAVNTVKAMAIDIESGVPILGNRFGGLSGPAIKPIAVRCIYEIYDSVKIPIIGSGGVTRWQDAAELLMAGASALQVGSAIMYNDLTVFREILTGLESFLERKGLRTIGELVGSAHRR